MKGMFVIIDGVADESCKALGDKTPLEAAKTPNLDEISEKSKMDYCYPVKEGVAPQSSSAIFSLLGYDPVYVPRGPLEAMGAGISLTNGDLALRTNFASVKGMENGEILDRRVGRTLTTKEAKILAKAINENVFLPFKFEFYSTVQHRGVLVLRGGFSDNITGTDPAYGSGVVRRRPIEKITFSRPQDEEDDSKLSADLVNTFIRKSFEVLDGHAINLYRRKKGLYPANLLLCRDAGNEPIKLNKIKGKWMALGYMPLEIGIAKATGMDVYKFKYPKLKGIDAYDNLYSGLKRAIKYSIKMLRKYRKKYDYFYIHFKETDTPGHDNKPVDKVRMIELLDREFFGFLKKFLRNERLVVTADHTTSCRVKGHTSHPVPVLIYGGPSQKKILRGQRFTEKEGYKGKKWLGRKLLDGTLFLV